MTRASRSYLLATVVVVLAGLAVVGASLGTHALSGGASPGVKGNPGPNPEAGMTDAQRIQYETTAFAQFEARRAAWFDTTDLSSLNYPKLDRSELQVQIVPPLQTFEASVAAARAIVIGSVKSIAPDEQGAVLTFDVEQSLKGGLNPGPIRIGTGSGVGPLPDWKTVAIGDMPGDPLLLPGQQVILFLTGPVRPGAEYGVESVTGHYDITPAGIQPLELNAFASEVSGQSEPAFLARIASAVSGAP